MDNKNLKNSLFDSDAEIACYKLLKELINTEFYSIIPHIVLKEIFSQDNKNSWDSYHVDFVIIDKMGYPVLGIEINGPEHWNVPTAQEHDVIKKQLFNNANIPLITIPVIELKKYEKNEFKNKYNEELKLLIIKYLTPFSCKAAFPVYCWKCGHQYDLKVNKTSYEKFYVCVNHECDNNKNNSTLSQKYVPHLLNANYFAFSE